MSGALAMHVWAWPLVVLVQGSQTQASEPPPVSEVEQRDWGEDEEWIELFPELIQEEVHAIREFFGTRLPDALDKYDLSLDYTPKFGDLERRDYLRFPLTLWYGATDQTDFLVGITPFTPNPFRSGEEWGGGLGEVRAGARHQLATPIFPFDQTFVGLDVEVPIGRPPPGIADYYGRLRPFVTSGRRIEPLRHTYFLLGLSHDHAFDVPSRSADAAFPLVHRTSISPGILYRPSNLGYLLEYSLRLIDDETDNRRAHVYKVGLIWDLPRRRSPRFLPGDWRVDVAYELMDEQGRDLDHSINLRVNIRFDFRRFIREVRKTREE